MSKVYTDNIEKRTGGAAITVPASGQWIDLASAAQGDVLYHNGTSYVRLAPGTAGQHLQTAGAGANPVWAAPPAGGLTAASQWRLTTSFTGDKDPIDSNLEEADDPPGFGVLGSSMTQSSGIFTFPSTGYWYITAQHNFYGADNVYEVETQLWIKVTIDNSTYEGAAHGVQSSGQRSGENVRGSAVASFIFDVTDVANCKVRFDALVEEASTTTMGSSAVMQTGMTFLRLADT